MIINRFAILIATFALAACAANDGPRIDSAGGIVAQDAASRRVDLYTALDPDNNGCWRMGETAVNTKDTTDVTITTNATTHTTNSVTHSTNTVTKTKTDGQEPRGKPANATEAQQYCDKWTVKGATPNTPPFSAFRLPYHELYQALGLEDQASIEQDSNVKSDRVRLARALQGFYKYQDTMARRNRIQQALVWASNSNCGSFLQSLHGVQGTTNFFLGSLATGTAGAGAIVTEATAARALAGTAGILSGLRAEMNEDFYRNIFSDALSKAIAVKRQEILQDMHKHDSQTVDIYPVEAAIADAVEYNNQCSLVAGISLISTSVNMSADPAGLRTLDAAFKKGGYDATVKVTVTKAYDSGSDGIGFVANKAEAAADVQVILGEAARVRAYAKAATAAIQSKPEATVPAAQKKTATDAIAQAAAPFGDPAANPPVLSEPLLTISNQMTIRATEYGSIAAQKTEANRDRIDSLLRANDTQAYTAMQVFKAYVADALGAIDAAQATIK